MNARESLWYSNTRRRKSVYRKSRIIRKGELDEIQNRISILLTVLLVAGLAFFMNVGVQESENAKNESSTEEKSQPEEKELTQEKIRESIEKKRKMALEKELNPFGYAVAQEELKDVHFQRYIHGMTHQKIIADDDNAKWRGYFNPSSTVNRHKFTF